MGKQVGVWEGLVSAFADTLFETSGFALARSVVFSDAKAGNITIRGNHRFGPLDLGIRFIHDGNAHWGGISLKSTVAGEASDVFVYAIQHEDPDGTEVTFTLLDGTYTKIKVSSGLKTQIKVGDPVMCFTRNVTHMDDLRRSFFPHTAIGQDLDTLARNYGISRPQGLSDLKFRKLLEVMIYLDATTVYSLEKVLAAVRDPGTYEIYEDLESHPRKVFVNLGAGLSSSIRGKAYTSGSTFPITPDTTTQITLPVSVGDNPIVYGIWAATDPGRTGTNHAIATGQIVSRVPLKDHIVDTIVSPALDPTDVGKSFSITGTAEIWDLLEMVDGVTFQVGRKVQTGGSVTSLEPTSFFSSTDYFEKWMIGHNVQIVSSDNPDNGQIVTITEVLTSKKVAVSTPSPAFVTEGDMTWRLRPNPLKATTTFSSADWTLSVFTITFINLVYSGTGNRVVVTPATMTGDAFVDYVSPSAPSAQLAVHSGIDGTAQYPFYLYDDTAAIHAVCKLITAAGVKPVIEVTL
jgi:hypothetical protein